MLSPLQNTALFSLDFVRAAQINTTPDDFYWNYPSNCFRFWFLHKIVFAGPRECAQDEIRFVWNWKYGENQTIEAYSLDVGKNQLYETDALYL